MATYILISWRFNRIGRMEQNLKEDFQYSQERSLDWFGSRTSQNRQMDHISDAQCQAEEI